LIFFPYTLLHPLLSPIFPDSLFENHFPLGFKKISDHGGARVGLHLIISPVTLISCPLYSHIQTSDFSLVLISYLSMTKQLYSDSKRDYIYLGAIYCEYTYSQNKRESNFSNSFLSQKRQLV